MNIQSMSSGTFVQVLQMLSEILDKGAAHAKAKGTDPNALLDLRLAPDMLPLSFQVRISCDHAKDAMARLTGQPLLQVENSEKTIADYKARIERTIGYVKSVKAEAFEGADNRPIEVPLMGDMVFATKGDEFLRDWVLPNFYFHVSTAYDILRHNGVELGKRDLMSFAGNRIRPKVKV